MPRRANNFHQVCDIARRQIALDAEKMTLNPAELEHFHWLMDSTAKLLAARAGAAPSPAPRQRKPRQKPAEATA